MTESSLNEVKIDPATVKGAAGFHRVGKDASGRWWMIDPDDRPWLFKGVCGLNRAGTQGGRLAKPGPYHDAIGRKFGEDPQPFVQACLEKMREAGFNAAGSWVTEEFFDQGLPYTDILECVKLDKSTALRGRGVRLPDVFDPKWHAAIDAQAKRLCEPLRDSRDLIGYFTDNEMGWGQPKAEHIWGASDEVNAGQGAPSLLQFCMTLPEDRPACQRAWQFALERHGNDVMQLSRDWGVAFSSKQELDDLTEQQTALGHRRYIEDHVAFTALFAGEYFRLTAEAIHRHDPNHLILGCRYGAPPGPIVLKAMDGHVDIISANNYRDNMYERMDEYAEHSDLPIIIGEFSWASDYFRVVPMDGEPAEVRQEPDLGLGEDERIRRKGREALERAFTHPQIVGYTWYRWVHRFENMDKAHYGFVNLEDELNRFNLELLQEIHPRLEAIAAGAIEPYSPNGD